MKRGRIGAAASLALAAVLFALAPAAGAASPASGAAAGPGTPPPEAGGSASTSPTASDATALAEAAGSSTSAAGVTTISGLPPIVDPNAPFVLMADVFVLVPAGGVVHVQEVVTGANRSSAAVHGLTFALPPGAEGVQAASGVPTGALHSDSNGVHLQVDVAPGAQVHAAFTFSAPWAGGEIWLPVSYPTGELTAMVPQGRWAVSGPGFTSTGTLPLSGKVAVSTYTTVTPSAGALVPIRLRSVAWWNGTLARVVLALAAVVCGVATLVAARRRGRAARERRETELIDALAKLDLAHGRGEVDDHPYGERRQSLLDELEALHGG